MSAASYDVRIAHDLALGPSPDRLLTELMHRNRHYAPEHVLSMWADRMASYPSSAALAHTLEDFDLPTNVVGYVVDKSSYARVFVSAFNTLLDPGWRGNLTLELVNHSDKLVEIKAGDPIVQIAFHWLDEATTKPYAGKYLDQPKAAVPARYENDDGSWR